MHTVVYAYTPAIHSSDAPPSIYAIYVQTYIAVANAVQRTYSLAYLLMHTYSLLDACETAQALIFKNLLFAMAGYWDRRNIRISFSKQSII